MYKCGIKGLWGVGAWVLGFLSHTGPQKRIFLEPPPPPLPMLGDSSTPVLCFHYKSQLQLNIVGESHRFCSAPAAGTTALDPIQRPTYLPIGLTSVQRWEVRSNPPQYVPSPSVIDQRGCAHCSTIHQPFSSCFHHQTPVRSMATLFLQSPVGA